MCYRVSICRTCDRRSTGANAQALIGCWHFDVDILGCIWRFPPSTTELSAQSISRSNRRSKGFVNMMYNRARSKVNSHGRKDHCEMETWLS